MSTTATPTGTAPPPPRTHPERTAGRAGPRILSLGEPTAPATAPEEPRLIEHAYDGIQEYDNPLPGWWSAAFWASIVFSLGYAAYYHVGGWGSTPQATYEGALGAYQANKEVRDRAEAANASEAKLAQQAADGSVLAQGRAIFASRCASCHAEDGRGLIGPNLTDAYQLHGTTRMDLFTTVRNGVPGTAMLAWGEQLPAPDVLAVAAYVSSLRGQNLAGKPREGQRVEPFTP